MEITEVRIKLMDEPNDRLQAFCSITIDGAFVIRDLKIIQGTRGPFVAMPSRKLNDRCSRCGNKNELRAGYCCNCGHKLNQERANRDQNGRAKLYADIAHPINTECREMIQQKVLAAFDQEFVKAKEPGYVCKYDDYGESEFAQDCESPVATSEAYPLPKITPAVKPTAPKVPPLTQESSLERQVHPAEVETTGPHSGSRSAERIHQEDGFGIGLD
jgi:stage V sporulation protein G